MIECTSLERILKSIDPSARLDTDLKEVLRDFSDDYVNAVCKKACEVAAHRGSKRLEVKDVRYAIEHYFK